jgi:hypothetical protein
MHPNREFTVNEEIEASNKFAEDFKKSVRLTVELATTVKKNLSTKKILYEDYKEAFNYVGKIFPDIDVRTIDVRQCSPLLLKKLGYNGVGGFFEKTTKTVVISAHKLVSTVSRFSVNAKLKKDEVIVHELLHYCHDSIGSNIGSNLREEFAYGWSMPYLRKKGYSDEEIIKDNYMPYLYRVCNDEGFLNILKSEGVDVSTYRKYSNVAKNKFANRVSSKVHKEILRLATEKGREIINIYEKKMQEGLSYRSLAKPKQTLFDVLDFD